MSCAPALLGRAGCHAQQELVAEHVTPEQADMSSREAWRYQVGVALSIYSTVTRLLNAPLLSVTTTAVARALGLAEGAVLRMAEAVQKTEHRNRSLTQCQHVVACSAVCRHQSKRHSGSARSNDGVPALTGCAEAVA